MHFEFGLRSSLLLIFFTHLLVYTFLFWKRGMAQERLSDKLLGTFLFLSALFIFPWMSGFAGWYDTQPYREILFYTPFIHALWFGPLLFFYLKSLTNTSYKLNNIDLLHFLPGMLYLLWCLIVVLTDKLIVGHYYLMNGRTDPDFDLWYNWLWSGSILIYLIMTVRYFRAYLLFTNFEFSFADSARFKWLRNFLYAFSLLTILLISEHILSLFIEMWYIRSWYYFFAFAILAYYIAISAYSAKPIGMFKMNFDPQSLRAYQQPLLLPEIMDVSYELLPQTESDPSWMSGWQEKVSHVMETQKVYLEPELTLTELAKKLGTNASLLSKVINTSFGQSFNDYVNGFRVQEAIRLMADEQNQHLNLLGIAYEAGFNSKSTFNRAFKKVTSIIPKDYQQQNTDSRA